MLVCLYTKERLVVSLLLLLLLLLHRKGIVTTISRLLTDQAAYVGMAVSTAQLVTSRNADKKFTSAAQYSQRYPVLLHDLRINWQAPGSHPASSLRRSAFRLVEVKETARTQRENY